jgi:hypothetical protein
VAQYFLNGGTICPPINFSSKNVMEVAGKKDGQPLTATSENFTAQKQEKYTNEKIGQLKI